MKRTEDEALREIMHRSQKVALQRMRRACKRLSGAAGLLLSLLVLAIAFLPGHEAGTVHYVVYGSFLLSQEAGGYVLAAVLAFVLGVAVTLICLWQKNKKENDGGDEK